MPKEHAVEFEKIINAGMCYDNFPGWQSAYDSPYFLDNCLDRHQLTQYSDLKVASVRRMKI